MEKMGVESTEGDEPEISIITSSSKNVVIVLITLYANLKNTN